MSDQTDKPGTDWAAKHAAAGQNADQPQHSSYITADGPVEQHNHPLTDNAVLDLIHGQ